jgi:hypothetical protein
MLEGLDISVIAGVKATINKIRGKIVVGRSGNKCHSWRKSNNN